jgi:hypothetical protein
MNKLPNGTAMRNGQMILDTSSPLHPRNGAAKKLTIGFGMRRRTAGETVTGSDVLRAAGNLGNPKK